MSRLRGHEYNPDLKSAPRQAWPVSSSSRGELALKRHCLLSNDYYVRVIWTTCSPLNARP